ncbi:endonuclease I family protein [Paenibacillus aurantiacus]|uniref:Endonuclease I family protein n=1 Tax=Paenibacillus aurantiacus TaxID=1936118 RepID=A0ABV5KR85_9BACL
MHQKTVQTPIKQEAMQNGGSYRVLDVNLDQMYYKNAMNKSGTELKKALHDIVSKQKSLTYDEIWEAVKKTDEDPHNSNNVILFYSGQSDSKLNTDHGGNDNSKWNREHVWAQSHGDFGTAKGIGTDLHHLRPENKRVNGDRGDKDFDNLPQNAKYQYTSVPIPDTYWDKQQEIWDPRDEVKGDVARIMFYMDTRYEDSDSMDLELVNQLTDSHSPKFGNLSTLMKWHELDPVDDFEKRRNEVIYSYQGNRNPFIDHPEWVSQIWRDAQ